jgi:60 kDa SS-A/Ro ribonucleoprotein
MANRGVFANKTSRSAPAANAVNEAGGRAYDLGAEHGLAQLACTGTFANTFYTKAEDQADRVLELARKCSPEFVAKVAIHSREHALMKDMPAYLVAYLSTVDTVLFREVFPRVINNGKMLRNFVQIIRSGKVGRKSLGHAPQRMVQLWLETHSDEEVFRASVGNDPSLADVINLARPRPMTKERAALYAHLLGREKGRFNDKSFSVERNLPTVVAAYERYRKDKDGPLPDVPFEMLTGLELDDKAWKEIARRATWAQTRQNLATFARHGVFKDSEMTKLIANRLRDEKLIKKAGAFPYQLLMAFLKTEDDSSVPNSITLALQDAMEVATENVPSLDVPVYVFPDISGSMDSPATGDRGDARGSGRYNGSTSKVTCRLVAALVASTMLRRNQECVVWPFESKALTDVRLNPRDSIMTNAKKLAGLPCGGTNCSAPMIELAKRGADVGLVLYVSDNESWLDSPRYGGYAGNWHLFRGYTPGAARTETLNAWEKVKHRNRNAKLVCLDVTPYETSQVINRQDILNVGGFSDNVFEVISSFTKGSSDSWVEVIKKIAI